MSAVANVLPLNEPFDEHEDVLTEWMDGTAKPEEDGPYLRQFDEGEAISWWYEKAWHMDSFFAGPSDIQNAPWKGIRVTPNPRSRSQEQEREE